MVEIYPEIITTIGTGIAAGVISNFITNFLTQCNVTISKVTENYQNNNVSIASFANLHDFRRAYEKKNVEEGDLVSICGIFSNLGLTVPISHPDEVISATKKSLDALSVCFSNNNLKTQEKILQFDAHIDMLRLWLGSCMRLLPIKGYYYGNLFSESDIIPIKGLPIFIKDNVKILSNPFYGQVTGHITKLPSYWQQILKIKNNDPIALIVDGNIKGKIQKQRTPINPLYLSYWIILKYQNGDECIIATRGDYSSKRNYQACRDFLRTIADVEIRKMRAQLLFEYDQINRVTSYEQLFFQNQISSIFTENRYNSESKNIK